MRHATMRRLLATCMAAGSVVTGSAPASAATQFVYLTNYVDFAAGAGASAIVATRYDRIFRDGFE